MTPLALLALAATIASPAAPQLQIHVPAGEPTVGDPIAVEITLVVPVADLTGDPLFSDWGNQWGEAEVLRSSPPERLPDADEWARFHQTVVVTLFRTGDVELPPVSVGVPTSDGEIVIEPDSPVRVRVGSVLPEGEEQLEPRPAEPPRPLAIGRPFWWTLAVLAAAALSLLIILIRQKRQETAREIPRVEPLVALTQWLKKLRDETDPERLHTSLSMAFRRFLGSNLDFAAAEATTREIHLRLGTSPLSGAVSNRAVDLLKTCDQIKFARREVAMEEARRQIDRTAELAIQIDEALTPDDATPDLQEETS